MATITTKFNVGDKAFTIDKKTMKIREFEVDMVSIYLLSDGKPDINYKAKDDGILGDSIDEDKCFPTKHELLTYIEQSEEQQ